MTSAGVGHPERSGPIMVEGVQVVSPPRLDVMYRIFTALAILKALLAGVVAFLQLRYGAVGLWTKIGDISIVIGTSGLLLSLLIPRSYRRSMFLVQACSSAVVALMLVVFLVVLYPTALGNNDTGEVYLPVFVMIVVLFTHSFMAAVRFKD